MRCMRFTHKKLACLSRREGGTIDGRSGKMPYTLRDLEMPDDEPMVIIRSSLLWICDGDKYAAASLNMYIHWTRWIMKHKPVAQKINQMQKKQGKTPTQDTSLVIYRKQNELVEDMLNFCNEKRLRQANVFLVSKGLLKIEDMPRHIADHVLKYELQIDTFKMLMNDWRKYREGNQLSDEDEMVEVALQEDVDGTDNSPLRNGQLPDRSSSQSGQFTAPKVIDNKLIDKKQIGSTALRANNNASSVSKKVNEKSTLTEEEQSFWSILCEARKLQEKRLYRELEAWSKPTKLQREQITSIVQKVQEQGFSISRLTPEMIEQAWIDEMEEKKYLKKDPKWEVGNLESALISYLTFSAPLKQYNPTPPTAQTKAEEQVVSDELVLWTKTPGKIGNDIASFWTILEWMPESEARRKYYYSEYSPFSVEEIERYKQLSQMAIAG
jgi:hypothetical protein